MLLLRGGFAAVWLARDASGRDVAVKQISRVQGGESYIRESRVNAVFFDSEGHTK